MRAKPTATPKTSCSVYPLHPKDSRVILRISGSELTFFDRILVYGSSLSIVGSVIWVLPALVWCWRRWKRYAQESGGNREAPRRKRLKALYGTLIVALLGLIAWGPHRKPAVGKWLQVRSWALWKAWLRFVSFEVVQSRASNETATTPAPILAFFPHGIFPFAFGLGALPELAQKALGEFRPVVATAIQAFPLVRSFVGWAGAVDASRALVERVMQGSETVGLCPGGIAEIFESYPKTGTHPDEEYAIVRKGFLKMAIKYGRPVTPIYCFGSTKMFRRLNLPVLEYLSNLLRISICIFYGVCGLPLPFRNRLLYVVGDPIHPPTAPVSGNDNSAPNKQIEELHKLFCESLQNLFERHKEAYGWTRKTLKIISR